MNSLHPIIAGLATILLLSPSGAAAASKPAQGPLRIHPTNPRYFTDGTTNAGGSPRAVYLGGHQIFVDLQDNSFNKEWTRDMGRPDDPAARTRLLDWDRYLDFLERHKFNYVRNWIIWSTGSGKAAPPNRIASPMPFLRTGPGTANDGKLKFDLHRFDEDFFRRLHARARALQGRGIYLEKMVDALNGLDNVLWEICNETPPASIAWQDEMLRYLKAYEARQPKQHLVLVSALGGSPEEKYVDGPADCIATMYDWMNKENPKTYKIKKPVIMDLDHVAPGDHDPALIWRAFTRGYHFNLYDNPFESAFFAWRPFLGCETADRFFRERMNGPGILLDWYSTVCSAAG